MTGKHTGRRDRSYCRAGYGGGCRQSYRTPRAGDRSAFLDVQQGCSPGGVDPFEISILRRYMEDMRQGAFAFEGGVTDTVEALTGSPAETFEDTARRYAVLPFARRSLARRAKALAGFMMTPFLPGYELTRLEQQWRLPAPAAQTFALNDARWRDEHVHLMAKQPRVPFAPEVALLRAVS